MPMSLSNHPFVTRCLDHKALLEGVSKFNTYDSRLKKQAKQYANGDVELENEYKGWVFEIFVIAMINWLGNDKRVGIVGLQIVDEDDDIGVDFLGTGINGKPATVQAKYRQAIHELSANKDHLSNFTSASVLRYGVDPADTQNMLIVTCGKDLKNFTAQNMFRNKVRWLNREKIRVLVDDNVAFWNAFREVWNASLPEIKA